MSARYFAAPRHLPARTEPEGRRRAQDALPPLQPRVVAPLLGGDGGGVGDTYSGYQLNSDYLGSATERGRRDIQRAG